MKPIPAEIEKLNPVSNNAAIPPTAAKVHSAAPVLHLWHSKKYKQNDKDNSDTHRNHLGQTLGRPLLVLKISRPFQRISFRKMDRGIYFLLCLCHRRSMSRPRTENLTAQKRVWLSLKISKGPVMVRISANSLTGIMAPSLAGTNILPI